MWMEKGWGISERETSERGGRCREVSLPWTWSESESESDEKGKGKRERDATCAANGCCLMPWTLVTVLV